MKKIISTPIAIIIIVVFTLLVGGAIAYQYWFLFEEISAPPVLFSFPPADQTPELTEQEQACINSGGTVITAMCCKSTGDFPNLCLIGPCGCSPENSHEVKICECQEGKCFDGEECVPF